MAKTVKRHGGFAIRQSDDGFSWSEVDDAFDTLAECVASVDDFNSQGTPENIYNMPGIRQSIEEDRRSNR